MRIVVIIADGHPELMADLGAIPVRYRADRMRTLATLGLISSRGGVTSSSTHRTSSPNSDKESTGHSSPTQLAMVRTQLRKSLLG